MSEQFPNRDYDADEVINDFKEKFKWPKTNEVQAIVKPGKVWLRLLISAVATIIAGGVIYYMMLPALNFKDSQMYVFIIALIAVFLVSFSFACRANKMIERKEYVKKKINYSRYYGNCSCCGYGYRLGMRCNNFPCRFLQQAYACYKQ